jgi:hypothetical protein
VTERRRPLLCLIPGHGSFAIFIEGGIHHGLWQR